jgi:hypothetical protein
MTPAKRQRHIAFTGIAGASLSGTAGVPPAMSAKRENRYATRQLCMTRSIREKPRSRFALIAGETPVVPVLSLRVPLA